MKPLKIFIAVMLIASAFSLKSTAQTGQWLSTEFRKQTLMTTTDSAYNTIETIKIAANESGIVELQVVGYNDSLSISVTGRQLVRYKKVGGTLTLGTPTNILAKETDTGLQYTNVGSTFDVTTSGNNIIIRVKGRLGYTIRWDSRYKIQKRIKGV